jgi:hypothetical protein
MKLTFLKENKMQTVEQVLTAATDSVTLINDINSGTHNINGMTQEEINDMVQRNVDHLELILAYTEPDVVGDSSDKTSYTTAITTGKAYLEENS